MDKSAFIQQLKTQLRDIHTPEDIGMLPLALGWWLLLVFALIFVAFLTWKLVQHIRGNRYRRHAATQLENAFKTYQKNKLKSVYLQRANQLVKQSLFSMLTHRDYASHSGEKWRKTLDKFGAMLLSERTKIALAFDVYKPENETDINAIHAELMEWIKRHRHVQGAGFAFRVSRTKSQRKMASPT